MKAWSKIKNSSWYSDQTGSMLVYSTVVFSSMFLVGGAAVDFARHEQLRASMQYNLDRAVLAAASLKQTQEPADIVNSYMDSVQTISEFSVAVNSDIGLSYRSVSATASASFDTWFLRIAGIQEMEINAASAAEEKIPNLEIALVLDVSGSMGSNSKLTNLKTAAKEFVTTMLTEVEEDTVAISIIPFNHSVAPSQEMFEAYTMDPDTDHNYSTCIDFLSADFRSIEIDTTELQTQATYSSMDHNGFNSLDDWYRSCYTDSYFEILPYSSDVDAVHAKIDGLQSDGMTGGHLGMKWAGAMLDPSFNPVITNLIAEGVVEDGFATAPVAYGDAYTLKVIIFMGDGANTLEYRMHPDYRGEASPLYEVQYQQEEFVYAYNTFNHNYTYYGSQWEYLCDYRRYECVYEAAGDTVSTYYVEDGEKFLNVETDEWILWSEFELLPITLEGYVSHRQLGWDEAWGLMSPKWLKEHTDWDDPAYEFEGGYARTSSEADNRMEDSCNSAKDAGIVVYSIGFETGSTTSAKLADCASSSAHYYDAAGTQISYVFGAIAASIQKLKLTQ